MDSERIIPGAIIVLIVIIPIIILKLKSGLKKRKIIGALFKLAEKQNTNIIKYDQWNNSAIGLTKNGAQVLGIRIEEGEKSLTIGLSSLNKCRLRNDNAGAVYQEGNFKVTTAIDLELVANNNVTEQINFYHIQKDGPLLTGELELAQKWCKLINQCIEKEARYMQNV